jgi:hypothetical protein
MAGNTARGTSMRTALGRVRHLGSAKEGVHHWWMQRLTALALVPLVLWFVVSLAGMGDMDHAAATAWIGSPSVAITLVLLIGATFYHAQLPIPSSNTSTMWSWSAPAAPACAPPSACRSKVEDRLHHQGLPDPQPHRGRPGRHFGRARQHGPGQLAWHMYDTVKGSDWLGDQDAIEYHVPQRARRFRARALSACPSRAPKRARSISARSAA